MNFTGTLGSSDAQPGQIELGLTADVALPPTTLALPVTAGLAFDAFTVSNLPTTLGLPVATRLTFTAVAVVTTTLSLPLGMGLVFDATTDLSLPVSVGLAFAAVDAAVITGVTTLTLGVTTGLGFAATSTITLAGWTADISQRSLLEIISGTGELDYTPAAVYPADTSETSDWLAPVGTLVLPPTRLTERQIRRHSVSVPALTATSGRARVSDAIYDAYPTIVADVGVPHLLIAGVDVTYFRRIPTTINTDRQEAPFGDVRLSIDFPQLTPFEGSGAGVLSWLYPGAPVDLVMLRGSTMTRLWAGYLISDDNGSDADAPRSTWAAEGSLFQASWTGHKTPTIMDSTDIGTVISKAFNTVTSRRYAKIPVVATGIPTRVRGTGDQSEMAYVQGLLATAWTPEGRQWSVIKTPGTGRTYTLGLKNVTTIHQTVTVGARGIDVDLSRDLTATANVIRGRGIGPDGYSWAGWVYPNLLADTAPAYPYASPSTVMTIGATDAGTVSGTGVSDWQRRVNELNLSPNVVVDGVFNSGDAAVCRDVQDAYGLTVDGVVGPQTWAATFAVGSGSGDLSGAYRKPLAIDQRCEQWLYSASGAITGPNPLFNNHTMLFERDVSYEPGTTKAQATASAKLELSRDKNPSLTGRIVLTGGGDPREGSRFLIRPGQNVRVLGYNGADRTLHIVAVERDWANLSVTLEVDERGRDAMTLASIRDRVKDARNDPARRPGPINRRSRLEQDVVVEFDGESSAGVLPRMALYGGLWSVVHIPISQVGRIASIKVATSGPKAKFYFSLFAGPVTPAHLVSNVGNPGVGDNPFARTEAKADALDALGFIEAFGGPGSATGYWPGEEGKTPVTGRMIETAALEYVSAKPPWVWLAIYSPTSCFIQGRLRPAPIQ